MKKHMSGFVPVNFKQVGVMLLIIGLIVILLKFFSYLTSLVEISNYVLYFGIGLMLISLYLIFVVPKE
ncbi:hypothetical protein KKA15_01365 [Patescibacteria group bacterium]|nr:hypothetical protein [Patescibacteria group bacterium]